MTDLSIHEITKNSGERLWEGGVGKNGGGGSGTWGGSETGTMAGV